MGGGKRETKGQSSLTSNSLGLKRCLKMMILSYLFLFGPSALRSLQSSNLQAIKNTDISAITGYRLRLIFHRYFILRKQIKVFVVFIFTDGCVRLVPRRTEFNFRGF